MKYFCLVVALAFSLPLMAQQQSPQEQEKMLRENIEESLEKYERTLELEYWQGFHPHSRLWCDDGRDGREEQGEGGEFRHLPADSGQVERADVPRHP